EQNSEDFDVVLLHNINPVFSWNKISENIKIFLTFHTTYFGYYSKLNHKLFRIYYKYMTKLEQKRLTDMNNKATFIGVSETTCDELSSQGVDKKNIRCISNGVDINRFKPNNSKSQLRNQLDFPLDGLLFLSIGRISAQKNLFNLLEVFKYAQTLREDIILIIAGTGELLQDLRLFAQKNNLKNIKFLGHVKEQDLPKLYASADFFIISSKYEGQPLTLLEAMASGLPCIVSNIPNLDVVKDANCGIVIDFDDRKDAAEKILRYIASDLPSIHSTNARNYAEKNLSWEGVSIKYLKEFTNSEDNL
ncbi:MAG: glycosyltransferase family 4 protein, partial [Candidatus Methanofastidiosa archaeon]|nr:glycosyltransferase family 4 protein [Candidatus Methanofastidiosa archaeon]